MKMTTFRHVKLSKISHHNLLLLFSVVTRDCDAPIYISVIVGSGGKIITDGGDHPIGKCFTGKPDQQYKHCPNPDGSTSFVSVASG